MILGSSEIYKRITEEEMISGIDDYNFIIEGATVDVRLDKISEHLGDARFYGDKRNVGDVRPVLAEELLEYKDIYQIHSNVPYLVSTIETFKMPVDVIGHIDTRTTMFRSGIILKATYLNPGYNGVLTFMIINHSPTTVLLQRGVRIAQIAFHEIKGTCEPYKGQWQGGKMHTNGEFVAPR